jgi:hypothetical protein
MVQSRRIKYEEQERRKRQDVRGTAHQLLSRAKAKASQARSLGTNKCGPGQPPEPHRFVKFLRCLVTAGRRNDAFSPTALLRVPHLPKAQLPVHDLAISNCNLCGGQRPFLLKEQGGGGGRNARATSPRVARFQLFPRRFTLVNHRLPLALPQSSSKFRNSHVFGESTFS